MVVRTEVKRDAYYDSVTLMLGSSQMMAIEGVDEAMAFMGTERNGSIIRASGLVAEGTPEFGANDTVIGVRAADDAAAQQALDLLEEFLSKSKKDGSAQVRPKTLAGAVKAAPDSNFSIISVPGRYARREAEAALDEGLHVLMFSDNVSLRDEIALKDKAVEKGLLMMGPDCGTAIVNGVALGFANSVRRGGIGLVAAAGTGLQEVTVLIDRLGGGVSQALGTGGRDLRKEVGGRMMRLCLEALKDDPATDVIAFISKPPHPDVVAGMKESLAGIDKPVVVCFLGSGPEALEGTDVRFAKDLEQTARIAVELAGVELPQEGREDELVRTASREATLFAPGQRRLRGLYSGGTLCYEALLALDELGFEPYSNIPVRPEMGLDDPEASQGNTLLDMGEDYFTDGLPHPMIDMRRRLARLAQEAEDPEVAVVLLDCVGGYGTHEDPAGTLAPGIEAARAAAEAAGRHLCVIASVCATESDPQNRGEQEEKLRRAGAIVCDCNAQAVRLAGLVLQNIDAR
ncbi:MAG: acyl-CoA synthetase FdrA [Atopobiaceae bacterium]|nr:acyl-CoA synthetase FdrA [Atopobiaceae bacterium]